MTRTLLVVVPDRLSAILDKGELAPRYYNPAGLFEEVHLLTTTDDVVDPARLEPFVAGARLVLHNFPAGRGLFLRTLGWRPSLLGPWAAPAVALAQTVQPALVRCHGAHLNLYLAWKIRRELGIPYVVSLHINPDEDVRGRAASWRDRLAGRAIRSIERLGLREAHRVLPVYRPIVPYLERLGVSRYEVVYNVLGVMPENRKSEYRCHRPARLLGVGRQFAEKNPRAILEALRDLPDVHLTLVGDGPGHEGLQAFARARGVHERVRFLRALPNAELCRTLRDYDLFVVHSEYWEISKAVLEALLAGLPVVINRRRGEPVPELDSGIVELVEGSPASYRTAIRGLLDDPARRERLGRAAAERAWGDWAPERMEARVAEIYREAMRG